MRVFHCSHPSLAVDERAGVHLSREVDERRESSEGDSDEQSNLPVQPRRAELLVDLQDLRIHGPECKMLEIRLY